MHMHICLHMCMKDEALDEEEKMCNTLAHTCIHTHTYIHVYACLHMCACKMRRLTRKKKCEKHTCAYMHMYIYIYTHTHIYTCLCLLTHVCMQDEALDEEEKMRKCMRLVGHLDWQPKPLTVCVCVHACTYGN
jgi:hypothetical protein